MLPYLDRKPLEHYINLGENIAIEFKRAGGKVEDDVYETICSFSNRYGGNIFLGITPSVVETPLGFAAWCDQEYLASKVPSANSTNKLSENVPSVVETQYFASNAPAENSTGTPHCDPHDPHGEPHSVPLDIEQALLSAIMANNKITRQELASLTHVSLSTVKRYLKRINHLVHFVGSGKSGHWQTNT